MILIASSVTPVPIIVSCSAKCTHNNEGHCSSPEIEINPSLVENASICANFEPSVIKDADNNSSGN